MSPPKFDLKRLIEILPSSKWEVVWRETEFNDDSWFVMSPLPNTAMGFSRPGVFVLPGCDPQMDAEGRIVSIPITFKITPGGTCGAKKTLGCTCGAKKTWRESKPYDATHQDYCDVHASKR